MSWNNAVSLTHTHIGVARNFLWRGPKDRGAGGVEGEGYGEGCSLPSRLWGLEERRKLLPQRGLGRSPGRKRVLVYLELERTQIG